MADQKQVPQWLGRPILDEADIPHLEADAGIREFIDRLPRQHAEEAAYQGYKREKALDAAAHHLSGIMAAHASGVPSAGAVASDHGQAYADAMAVLGHDPTGPVPKEVLDRRASSQPVHRFKKHPGDALWAPPEPEASIASSSTAPGSAAPQKSPGSPSS